MSHILSFKRNSSLWFCTLLNANFSLGPFNSEFANITDKDINDNSKSIKVDGNSSDSSLMSDTMRDAIEKMRSRMMAMIPDIKRQEEAARNRKRGVEKNMFLILYLNTSVLIILC